MFLKCSDCGRTSAILQSQYGSHIVGLSVLNKDSRVVLVSHDDEDMKVVLSISAQQVKESPCVIQDKRRS